MGTVIEPFPANAIIPVGDVELPGDLTVPSQATGLIIFAHGSGSGRISPRNRFVASHLAGAGFATLLFDLLTRIEDQDPSRRFHIPLLAQRLVGATDWAVQQPQLRGLPVGYFGASTGAAAALRAAAARPQPVAAVVSRGGRPDLAGSALARVNAPTLLIVGSRDLDVIELNRRALNELSEVGTLKIVPGAGHLFEEPGALEQVTDLATSWFARYLAAGRISKNPSRLWTDGL